LNFNPLLLSFEVSASRFNLRGLKSAIGSAKLGL